MATSKTHGEEKHSNGGPSNMDRKKYGRNMSRVVNQKKGKSRG
jgi:hypothetical protein